MGRIVDGVPPTLAGTTNESVLTYLRDRSAHSDVASALTEALAPLGDVQIFSPDFGRYRYIAAASQGVVFAFAVGMGLIRFSARFRAAWPRPGKRSRGFFPGRPRLGRVHPVPRRLAASRPSVLGSEGVRQRA